MVVTGAARGIGKSIAAEFAAAGSRVVIVDAVTDVLEKTAAELKKSGSSTMALTADISDRASVESMAKEVLDTFGRVDVLVNNAGTFSVVGPTWEVDPGRWFRDIRVNLYGTFLVCRTFLKSMTSEKSGYVINMASSGGVIEPHPYATSYASSKTGIVRFTESLAIELESYNIKTFVIGPPAIMTDMTQFLLENSEAKKWRPGLKGIFDRGEDFPPELVSRLVVQLVSGTADRLSGRYFLATDNLDEIIANTDKILADDLMLLRIRR